MSSQENVLGMLWELNPIWEVLTDEEKQIVDNAIQVYHFKKNEIIHNEGDHPTHIMMLVSGKVRIYKEGINQKQQIIRLLKPYDIFGYRGAIIDGGTYNACASAFEPCVVVMLKREIFNQLLASNNTFCFRVLQMMARDLAHSEIQTVHLTQKHIRGRLAESVLTLKEHYGVEDDGQTIALSMSREDLANMSNMTTANAIRTLSQFAQEGLVRAEGKKIAIVAESDLKHISEIG